MPRIKVVKRPPYAVVSVDHALQILLILQEDAGVGVGEVASLIGTAPSTAHRLLSTLVYRGFAEQEESRRYRLGPAMRCDRKGTRALDVILRPHLFMLRQETGETVSAMVREGWTMRMLMSVESAQALRVTDRTGTVLPLAEASVGKAILAHLSTADLHRLYTSRQASSTSDTMSPARLKALEAELTQVRATGIGYNFRRTEADLAAVGCVVPAPGQYPWLGLAVSVPVERSTSLKNPAWHTALRETADRVATDLEHHGIVAPNTEAEPED